MPGKSGKHRAVSTLANRFDMDSAILDNVRFNADGLVPAITQQQGSGEVLMMAWMSRDTLAETLRTKRVCYWSRSRQEFWRKGDTSGHIQTLIEARLDCDGDTLLLIVDQTGAACHTGRRTCFYTPMGDGSDMVASAGDEGYFPTRQ